jgi:hypothetical protein
VRRRGDRWLLAMVAALAVAGAILVVTQPLAARRTADFTIGYSAALLLRQGQLAGPYDQVALGAMMTRTAGPLIDPRLPFNQPLAADLPFVALSFLPLDLAFRVWQLCGVGILLLTVLVLQRAFPLQRGAPALALLALLASVPAWAALTEGQVTPLLALGAALVVWALASDAPWLAAAGGVLLAFKPHYLPAYLIVLFAARRWRLLGAALAGAMVLLISPLAAGGISGLVAMVHNAFRANELVSVRQTEAWIGVLGPVIPDSAASAVSVGLFILGLGVLLVLAWRRPPIPAFAALGGWIAVLESPHALPHDLLILAAPAWLAFRLHRDGRMPSPVIALLLVDLALLLDQRAVGLVFCPVVMTAVVVWGWRSLRQRSDRPLVAMPAA